MKNTLLLEIGSATAKVYKYKKPTKKFELLFGDELIVSFITDSKLPYQVILKEVVGFLSVSFKVKGEDEYKETNKGEVFKIMATITSIIKDVLTINPEFKGVRYEPQSKGGDGTFGSGDKGEKRDKLYKIFILNQLKNKKINFVKQGSTIFAIFENKIKLKSLLEDPNVVLADNAPGELKWKDSQARTFGYIGPYFVMPDQPGVRHEELQFELDDDQIDINYDYQRDDISFAGRVWLKAKIITFWDYPKNFEELKKIAKDIKEAIGVNILTSDWQIEIKEKEHLPGTEGFHLIPILSFKKSQPLTSKELASSHLDLKKNKTVPDGWGSEKDKTWKDFQTKYTSENKKKK